MMNCKCFCSVQVKNILRCGHGNLNSTANWNCLNYNRYLQPTSYNVTHVYMFSSMHYVHVHDSVSYEFDLYMKTKQMIYDQLYFVKHVNQNVVDFKGSL